MRIRRVGNFHCVTYKGPKVDKTTKTRIEIELPLPGEQGTLADWKRLLAVLGFTSSLWAADPIIGTWVLNSTKTAEYEKSLNLTPADPSTFRWSSRTGAYKELEPGLIELTLTETVSDGSTEVSKVIWPAQGGIAEEESSGQILIVETRVAPGEWYVTRIQDGKQIQLMHKVVSEDEKNLRITIEGVGEWGSYKGGMVFDRQ